MGEAVGDRSALLSIFSLPTPEAEALTTRGQAGGLGCTAGETSHSAEGQQHKEWDGGNGRTSRSSDHSSLCPISVALVSLPDPAIRWTVAWAKGSSSMDQEAGLGPK